MKPFGYYSNIPAPYPSKSDYTTVYLYDKGKVVWSGKNTDFASGNPEISAVYHDGCVSQLVLDEEGYNAVRLRHLEEEQKLYQEFQDDLFEEFGVKDNPKRYKAFSYAWERGHANGYSNVHSVFADIVELIQEDS